MNVVITLGFDSTDYTVNEDEGALLITVAVDLQGRISEDAIAQVLLATTTAKATADGNFYV